MEANNKFLKFVAKLEQKMLDSNQESMILIGTQNEQFIGGSNDGRCTNDAQSCDSSINNRGFSTSSSKTARITHRVVADPQEGTVSYAGRGRDGTFSNESHHPYYKPKTDTPDGYVGSIQSSENSISFITGYDGTNPIAIGPTPDIDIDAKLSLVQDGDILNVTGQVMGDNFPNTEAFILDPSGQRLFLGVDVRASGNDESPTILFGPATENIMNISIQIKTNPENGNFMGVIQNGKLINLNDWNKTFTNQNPNPQTNEKK